MARSKRRFFIFHVDLVGSRWSVSSHLSRLTAPGVLARVRAGVVGAARGMIQDTLLWGTTALGGVAVQVAGHQESVLDMVLGAGPVVRAVLIILLGFSVGA